MNRRGPRLVAAVLVALVVVSTAATVAQDGDGYTLDGLRENGVHPADMPASYRMLDSTGVISVRYTPARPGQNDWQYLNASDTLRTNRITLWSFRLGESVEPTNVTLKIVYWERGSRRVQTENGTVIRPVVTNVSTQTETVTLDTGADASSVSLRPHYDGRKEVTMWVEQAGDPIEGARWRFGHHSSPVGQSIPFGSSWAAFLPWLFGFILVPAGLTSVGAIKAAENAVDRAGAGPGTGWWLVAAVAITLVVVFGAYHAAIGVVVRAPWVLGIGIGVAVFLVALLVKDDAEAAIFEQAKIGKAVSPLGDTIPDIIGEDGTKLAVAPAADDSQDFVVFRRGSFSAFLARWALAVGRTPDPANDTDSDDADDPPHRIDGSKINTEVDYGGDVADRKFYTADTPGQPVEFTSAKWTLSFPDVVSRDEETGWSIATNSILLGGLFVVLGYGLGVWVGGSSAGIVGAAVPLVLAALTPTPPKVEVDFAPVHASEAKAARVAEEQTGVMLDTFEDLAEEVGDMEIEALDPVKSVIDAMRRRSNAIDSQWMGRATGDDADAGPPPVEDAPTDGTQEAAGDD